MSGFRSVLCYNFLRGHVLARDFIIFPRKMYEMDFEELAMAAVSKPRSIVAPRQLYSVQFLHTVSLKEQCSEFLFFRCAKTIGFS